MPPARGDVWLVDLDPTTGHEQAGQRPALVVSVDNLNASPLGMAIILPITGTDRSIPTHVRVAPPEGGLIKLSVIMTEQIRAVSRWRLSRRLGAVEPATMAWVEDRLRLILGL